MKFSNFKIKHFMTALLLVFGLFSFSAHAGITDAFKSGSGGHLDKTASKMGYTTGAKASSPESIVANIIQMVLSILGVLFVIYMVYGGILWMTAGGNDQRIERAKNLIKRAIIGLLIVFLAYAISIFLVGIFIDTTPS